MLDNESNYVLHHEMKSADMDRFRRGLQSVLQSTLKMVNFSVQLVLFLAITLFNHFIPILCRFPFLTEQLNSRQIVHYSDPRSNKMKLSAIQITFLITDHSTIRLL